MVSFHRRFMMLFPKQMPTAKRKSWRFSPSNIQQRDASCESALNAESAAWIWFTPTPVKWLPAAILCTILLFTLKKGGYKYQYQKGCYKSFVNRTIIVRPPCETWGHPSPLSIYKRREKYIADIWSVVEKSWRKIIAMRTKRGIWMPFLRCA